MITVQRTFKLFRLDVDNVPSDISLVSALEVYAGRCMSETLPLSWRSRYHLVHDVKKRGALLLMVFASYAIGDHPDVINTTNMAIQPNPLSDDQEMITYSHAVVWQGTSGYLLLLDTIRGGFSKGGMDKFLKECFRSMGVSAPIDMVAVSPEEDFYTRVRNFDRVVSFSIRFKRHDNPGISRALNNIADKADEAGAASVETVTKSFRGGSLSVDKGMIPWGKEQMELGEVDRLSAEGYLNDRECRLSTDRLDQKYVVNVEAGRNGKPRSADLFKQLSDIVEEIFF